MATGRRWTYAELVARVDALALGLLGAGVGPGDRVGIWAPNVAGVGARPVRHRQDRRDPGQHQPRLPHARAGVRAQPVRRRACWSPPRSFKTSDYAAMIEEVRPRCPGAAAGGAARHRPTWDALAGGRAGDRAELARVQASLSPDDPINIQYTSGTTGFPKGATLSHHNILNNGFFVGEPLRLHRGGPGLHPRALLPLLRHGDGQPRLHHARRVHGHPRARRSTRPRRCAPSPQERCTSLYGVPTMFIAELGAPGLRRPTTCRRCAPASWPARPARSR